MVSNVVGFQSTHPQGVGQYFTLHCWLIFVISIHPPARDGTERCGGVGSAWVFQSTHPQGVGRGLSHRLHSHRDFNPPTRKGWDSITKFPCQFKFTFQSTHPQGVGPDTSVRKVWGYAISIHPPARGGTQFANVEQELNKFQSTHPQGVGRKARARCLRACTISIHPPARGGTVDSASAYIKAKISIHPPARGGTAKPLTT